ncbi:methyltransferase-like protein 22 isoform 2-T3 [Pholidichthys leucotaenia]
MERIIFQYDTVLSDVHMLLPSARHLMTRLNNVGQPVFLSKFKILAESEDSDDTGKGLEKETEHTEPKEETKDIHGQDGEKSKANMARILDEDGDLDVTHRPKRNLAGGSRRELVCPVILHQSDLGLEQEEGNSAEGHNSKDVIWIEHTMATPLEDVGKQVWRGAFFLADFILSNPALFRGAKVVELGAGTGLTSIVMATVAKVVYCTDVGEDILIMCKRNVTLNTHLLEPAGGEVRVRRLDWLQDDFCTEPDTDFNWTEEEVADLHNNTNVIIAADVCYDDDLTDGFFRTLYRLCSNFNHTCTVFISIEKRSRAERDTSVLRGSHNRK